MATTADRMLSAAYLQASFDVLKAAEPDDDGKPLPVPHRGVSAAELRQLEQMPAEIRRDLTPDELGERLRHAVSLQSMAAGLSPQDAAPIHAARAAVLHRPGARAET
jgi:hypothetical protein